MIVYYEVCIDQNHNKKYCDFRVINNYESVLFFEYYLIHQFFQVMGYWSKYVSKDGVFHYNWYIDMEKLDTINLNKDAKEYIDKNIRRLKLVRIITGQKF